MPAGEERRRASAALDACVAKIQALQRDDGSFSKDGWAPVLSSAFAANGLYAARDVGAKVAPRALARSEAYMMKGYDAEKKEFRTQDSAGVALYQAAGLADGRRADRQDGRGTRQGRPDRARRRGLRPWLRQLRRRGARLVHAEHRGLRQGQWRGVGEVEHLDPRRGWPPSSARTAPGGATTASPAPRSAPRPRSSPSPSGRHRFLPPLRQAAPPTPGQPGSEFSRERPLPCGRGC